MKRKVTKVFKSENFLVMCSTKQMASPNQAYYNQLAGLTPLPSIDEYVIPYAFIKSLTTKSMIIRTLAYHLNCLLEDIATSIKYRTDEPFFIKEKI